jgi:CBS domain containing-hemolysin-like protein
MALLLFYAFISIFFSFLCSILEAVLLSITPTFLNVKKKDGKAYASSLEALKKDVDKPLIAILTLNTIAHTVGAILVGVQAESLDFDINIMGINIVGIVSAIMTLLILVLSEIIPKTIGATYWKKLANFTDIALKVLIFPLKWTGILWLLQLTTKLIGGSGHHGSVLSREDFSVMTDIAEKEGVFQESESKVIRNMLNFKEVLAKHIMTPRTVITSANEKTKIEDFYTQHPELKFSRIPIYSETKDHITGYFLKDQMLENIVKGKGSEDLNSIKREILVIERNYPIPDLFETLIEKREHIALVVDEFGAPSGIVSQEDVIETLLGLEIMDESDQVADLQELARKTWEKRAKRLGIIDAKED